MKSHNAPVAFTTLLYHQCAAAAPHASESFLITIREVFEEHKDVGTPETDMFSFTPIDIKYPFSETQADTTAMELLYHL